MGTCNYCGQGIAICVNIQSSDGKKFTVGVDCAEKVFLESNQSLTPIKRIRAEIAKQQRDAKNELRRQARESAYQAKLQAERDKNGGLTDRELIDAEQTAIRNQRRLKCECANRWLVDVLKLQCGDFVNSMIEKLETSLVSELSPRCRDILEDIYAKSHGRRGSKAYEAAQQQFQSNIGE